MNNWIDCIELVAMVPADISAIEFSFWVQRHNQRASDATAPGRQGPGGSKVGNHMNILNAKKDFLPSKNFKLLRQISVNSINVFLKFVISLKGDHCD